MPKDTNRRWRIQIRTPDGEWTTLTSVEKPELRIAAEWTDESSGEEWFSVFIPDLMPSQDK